MWSEWGEWSRCSAECDGGRQTRSRICINDFSGDLTCPGDSVMTTMCNIQVQETCNLANVSSCLSENNDPFT